MSNAAKYFDFSEDHRINYSQTATITSSGSDERLFLEEFALEYISNDSIEDKFTQLAEQWRRETIFESSVTKIVLNDAYQQIIGMGHSVVSVILDCLQKQPEYWFWALKAITGEDPVPDEDKGDIQAMSNHWIKWGQDHEQIFI